MLFVLCENLTQNNEQTNQPMGTKGQRMKRNYVTTFVVVGGKDSRNLYNDESKRTIVVEIDTTTAKRRSCNLVQSQP